MGHTTERTSEDEKRSSAKVINLRGQNLVRQTRFDDVKGVASITLLNDSITGLESVG